MPTIPPVVRDTFVEAWGKPHFVDAVAPGLTCTEAEALAMLLRYLNAPLKAEIWLAAHGHLDEPGDLHHKD